MADSFLLQRRCGREADKFAEGRYGDEAHVSAEQALSQSNAWFSYAHEDERRPSRSEETPSEGKKEDFRVMASFQDEVLTLC